MASLDFFKSKKDLKEKIVSVTAYDCQTADWLAECDLDFILVGDSVANVIVGHASTLPMTMDEMIYHTRMVTRGAGKTPVIADMPFLSYEIDDKEAVRNAGRFIKEAGASGVKVEGAQADANVIRKIVTARIPVVGHVGLTPQSVLKFGGYKVQGRDNDSSKRIIAEALAVQAAGACAVVLECIPSSLALEITNLLTIPTIGIGAGADCDGQILVTHDLLGWSRDNNKFVKKYANFLQDAQNAVNKYADEVRNKQFPDIDHSF